MKLRPSRAGSCPLRQVFRLSVSRLRCQHRAEPVADAFILDPHLVEHSQHLLVEIGLRHANARVTGLRVLGAAIRHRNEQTRPARQFGGHCHLAPKVQTAEHAHWDKASLPGLCRSVFLMTASHACRRLRSKLAPPKIERGGRNPFAPTKPGNARPRPMKPMETFPPLGRLLHLHSVCHVRSPG